MEKIKTALASYGMSGRVFHGPLLKTNSNFEVLKILERTRNNSRKYFPNAEIVRDYNLILNDNNIDLVIVNVPDNLHYQFALQALEHNKHVVIEKPFTQKVSEGQHLIDLAKSKNLILSVFQNRRWDGDFLTVQKIIEQKFLGRLVEYEAHFDRFRNYIQDSWKEDDSTGTGTLYNLGPHLIDQALTLFGIPESVFAEIRKNRDNSLVDDAFEIKLFYPHVKVLLKASYLTREAGPRYLLHGTEGSFLKWGIDPQEEALNKGFLPNEKNWGEEKESEWGILNTNLSKLHFRGKIETIPGDYNIFYQNIFEAIKLKKDLFVKPEEALNVIKIIEACYKSNENKEIVSIH